MPTKPSPLRLLCRRLADAEWLLLALLLPAVLFPTPQRLLLLLLLPLPWLARKIAYGRFVEATPLDPALLLLLITLLVSLYATFDIAFSAPRVTAILYGVALFYAAAGATGRSWRNLAAGVALLLVCGLAVACLALIGTRWGAKTPSLAALTAALPFVAIFPAAPQGFSPNQIAGTLLWILPVMAAALVIISRPQFRPGPFSVSHRPAATFMLIAGSLLMVGALLLTQSRSGLVGLACALLFFAAISLALSRRALLFTLLAALLVTATAAAAWTFAQGPASAPFEDEAPVADGAAFEDGAAFKDGAMTGRLEIWSRALYAIEDFPLTGIGVGTFRRVGPILYPFFLVGPETDIAHAHNLWLQVALDLGLPGLVAYLALWLGAAAMLWRSWRSSSPAGANLLTLGFAAALLATFVYGLADTVALGSRPGFIFWLLLGLITGLHTLSTTPSPSKP